MTPLFRPATAADVPAIVALLADDSLGAAREGTEMAPYLAAFAQVEADPNSEIIVGEIGGEVIATYQFSILYGLSLLAATRVQIESVRVATALRGQGIGARMMQDAEARARARGASLMQLTTHQSRSRAHAFYERLGFTQSHKGYKRVL